jgi:HD-like signal output (HDOD) protein
MPLIPAPLRHPPRGVDAWTAHLRDADIPVLADTAAALESLRVNEDGVDANSLADVISGDPLMTLKVLRYSASRRGSRVVTDTETVTAALVMMGITPFFRAFGLQATVEDCLGANGEALSGLRQTLQRAHRAATFALGFAVHRRDGDAAVIHEAALLHDFAEMLLWYHAPELALRVRDAQRADAALRSGTAQRDILNVELGELQQSLMKSWRLPELLIRISDDAHADHGSVKSVRLAIRLARHTALEWENPAVPDDIVEIAALLGISAVAAEQFVRQLDR